MFRPMPHPGGSFRTPGGRARNFGTGLFAQLAQIAWATSAPGWSAPAPSDARDPRGKSANGVARCMLGRAAMIHARAPRSISFLLVAFAAIAASGCSAEPDAMEAADD